MSNSVTPWTTAWQASLSITSSWNLLKLMSIELVMSSNHLILCHLLLSPSIFPSIRIFSNESALHIRWPKDRSFSFSISPSNEYSELISFRMTGLICLLSKGLLRIFSRTVVQKHQFFGTQPFFMVQPSHPYMTTGKTIALAIWTFRYLLADQCPFILCRYLLSHCFGLPGNSLCLHNLWLAKCKWIAQIPEMSLKWYAY